LPFISQPVLQGNIILHCVLAASFSGVARGGRRSSMGGIQEGEAKIGVIKEASGISRLWGRQNWSAPDVSNPRYATGFLGLVLI